MSGRGGPLSAGPILVCLGGLWITSANLTMWGADWQGETTPHHGPGSWALKTFLQIDLADYLWWPYIGLLSGPAILLSLWISTRRPKRQRLWVGVVLFAATLNFLIGMGGFIFGVPFVWLGALIMLGWISEPPRMG